MKIMIDTPIIIRENHERDFSIAVQNAYNDLVQKFPESTYEVKIDYGYSNRNNVRYQSFSAMLYVLQRLTKSELATWKKRN